MTQHDLIERSTDLGRQAFLAGKPGIPKMDDEIVRLIENVPDRKTAFRVLKAWGRGWLTENLNLKGTVH